MGTSLNQPSPNETNWKPVLPGYTYENVPVERIIADIWRAVENDPQPLSRAVESEALYLCMEAVGRSDSIPQAIRNVTAAVTASGQNSIAAELAKRAIPTAFKADMPAREWRAALFSELTDYLVSRDVAGYVGPRYRNKSVGELLEFKQEVKTRVRDLVRGIDMETRSPEEWGSFVREAIATIRGGRR